MAISQWAITFANSSRSCISCRILVINSELKIKFDVSILCIKKAINKIYIAIVF